MLQSRNTATKVVAVLAAMVTAVATVALATTGTAAARPPADEGVFRVTVTNTTDGQYLTPPNWAAHGRSASVFSINRTASDGVRAVAENGGVPVLAAELDAALDQTGAGVSGVALPSGDAPPPIFPGESRTFEFSTSEDRFSLVSMIICTNDGFGGVDSRRLPNRVGQSVQHRIHGYDAGTEINTELDADLVPAPFCADPSVGTGESNPSLSEDGVVRRHRGITGVGDLSPEVYDWNGPVGTVMIERIG